MDLEIKDVAELLNVSQDTVNEWIETGNIPCYRLNNEVRFTRMEIEQWMLASPLIEEKGGVVPGSQQFSLFRAIHRGVLLKEPLGETKEEIISNALIKIADPLSYDAEVITELFLDRERLMPTAFSNGIAVPHTRDFLFKRAQEVISVAFLEKPIDWGALDGKPTSVLFFLFSSNDKRHLHLLAKIAHLSNDPRALDFLKQQPDKIDLLDFIRAWEPTLHRTEKLTV